MGLPGTESYLKDVFLVQEGILLRLGCIYLALVETEKKPFYNLCIAPVLCAHSTGVTWSCQTLYSIKCYTEFVARRLYRLAAGLNFTGVHRYRYGGNIS